MGILPKLVTSYMVVIVMMIGGYSLFDLVTDFRSTRIEAQQRAEVTRGKLLRDLTKAKAACENLAYILIEDGPIMKAYVDRNRSTVAKLLDKFLDDSRFPGFITLVDTKGNVFYSTETPSKHGYSAASQSEAIQFALRTREKYDGASDFSMTKAVTVSSMVPFKDSKGKMAGLVVVSQPINNEYLTGEVTKFELEELDPVRDIDLAMFSTKVNKVTAATQGLRSGKGGNFIKQLNENGAKEIPGSMLGMLLSPVEGLLVPVNPKVKQYHFEKDGKWWAYVNFEGTKKADGKSKSYGYLMIATPVPDVIGKIFLVVLSAGAFGGAALLLAFLFSAKISSSVNEPLNFLIDRTSDIADRKAIIEPLEGLSGDWLELGEVIDTAVSTMRSTTQNLKTKLNRQKEELIESKQIAEESTSKISNLNRQISNQSKQITEIQRQINQANRQAIVVQHKLDAVLQSSTEGFLLLDQYGNILASNPVFLNWSGFSEGEIAGRQCFDLVRKPGEPRALFSGQAFAKHGGDPNAVLDKFHPECVIHHNKEDKQIEAIAHLQPIVGEDNSIQGYVMVLRDKSLRSENAKLREEIVSMLQDSIRVPIAEAESRWSSAMSNAKSTMHPQVVTSLNELHEIYKNLLAVVDSYLMMYGGFIPEPVVPKEPIVITRLVADCLDEVTPHARQRQLLLDYKTVTGLPTIYSNKESVRGVLVEVLNKLISITAAGGRVRVESSVRDGEMRLCVTSSGPALPEEEITDMFAGFIEGKHSEDTYAQRLSLYLARNNAERMGGQIWAESQSGRGTAIYCSIPANLM